eukprot:TRINITY_DN23355_c0_g1_i1.p1 TRINITY_DN23355_c0_g1~~TRINITY_DN23355_c0_g1_i1.p1  ORF type:complete len:437 (+),score=5.49 TRINITY_DN23355_c0_g1_i1:835-2145(+)
MMLLSIVEEWNWENGFVQIKALSAIPTAGGGEAPIEPGSVFVVSRPFSFKSLYNLCRLIIVPKVTHWEDLRPFWKIAELEADLNSPFRDPRAGIFGRRLIRFKKQLERREKRNKDAEIRERELQKKKFSGWGNKKRDETDGHGTDEVEESPFTDPVSQDSDTSSCTSEVADEEIEDVSHALHLWEGDYLMFKEEWEEMDQVDAIEKQLPPGSELLELPAVASLPVSRFSKFSKQVVTVPPFPARQLSKPFPWKRFALEAVAYAALAEGALASSLPPAYILGNHSSSKIANKFRPNSWPTLKPSGQESTSAQLSSLLVYHVLRSYQGQASPRRQSKGGFDRSPSPSRPDNEESLSVRPQEVDRASRKLMDVITQSSLFEFMEHSSFKDELKETASLVRAEGAFGALPPAIPNTLAQLLSSRLETALPPTGPRSQLIS